MAVAESLECRQMLAADFMDLPDSYAASTVELAPASTSFPTEMAISTNADGAVSVQTADVDGDGDLDVLSASADDDKIAWYENNGSNFTQRIISTDVLGAFSVQAADVDGDGDIDVLSASLNDSKIAWYENNGSQIFTEQVISTRAFGAFSVQAADVDGDGDIDVLSASASDNKIAWYENDGTQGFTERVISTNAQFAASVQVADVDGDGDLDVLSASTADNKIAWYQNDGSQNFTEHAISTSASGAFAVQTADVDGDGDLDVLGASSSANKIAWYENDGSQNFTERVISTSANGARSVEAADVDGDGDLDVLSASPYVDKIAWYENDGSQSFTERVISTNADGAASVKAADVDGDGDLDVLSASQSDDKIAWYENVTVGYDFGDAPSPYPTTLVNDGAYHDAAGPRLGATRDSESDGQADDGSDEDGVMFGAIQVGTTAAGVNVDLQNAATAKVDAWVDFNANGIWEPSEKILSGETVAAGTQTKNFTIPGTAVAGLTYARVRVSTDGVLLPTGFAPDGEVEDYQVNILPATPQVESVTINDGIDPSRSKITSLTVRFDTEVDHAALNSAFTVTNITTLTEVGSVNVAATDSGGKTTAVLTFAGASTLAAQLGTLATTLVDGNYRLDVAASQVKLADGNLAAMSADYLFGGQMKIDNNNDDFFRWYGDDNGDGFTDFTDFAGGFLPAFGSQSGVGTNYNEGLDGNGDGFVDFTDFASDFLPHFGTQRP
jgi:hypothetical protein